MEIRKADSKGRVTGFEPGTLYEVYREKGQVIAYKYGFSPGQIKVDVAEGDWDFILDREP